MPSAAADRFTELFEGELLEMVEDHPDLSQWSIAGKARKKPEDVAWWRANGPAMVQRYIDWRAKSGWRPWVTPDGDLAVELDISIGVDQPCDCPEREYHKGSHYADCAVFLDPIPLKMYVDQVMVVPSLGNQLCIVDLKTGSRTPESDLQLGVYRLGIIKKYGIDVRLGAYWMARKGELSEVFNLTHLRPELLELWFTRFREATDAGIFLPHPTFLCRACPMRDYCAAYGGSKQHMDPDNGGVE